MACLLLTTIGLSAKTIATVDGYVISEQEANNVLKIVTKGRWTYDKLREEDKVDLVKRLAIDKLVMKTAMKEISEKEKENIIAGYWLRQKAAKYTVSDKEAKAFYKKKKALFKDKRGKIAPFSKVKKLIKNSIAQEKAVAKLAENAQVLMDGKKISLAKKNTAKTPNTNGKYSIYVVKSGNTLSGIAKKYHISIKQLREMNGMDSTSVLKIGQKLKVPAN